MKLTIRLIFATVLLSIFSQTAFSYTSEDLDLKSRMETRLHDQVSSYLLRILDKDQFRVTESIEIFTANNKAIKNLNNALGDSSAVDDSWLKQDPQDFSLGVIKAQDYAKNLKILQQQGQEASSPNGSSSINKVAAIKSIKLYLSFRSDVDANVKDSLKDGVERFVFTNFQEKPSIEISKFSKPESSSTPSIIDRLHDFSLPLSALILSIAFFINLLIAKKMPAWNEVEQHKIQLQQLDIARQSSRQASASAPDQPITTPTLASEAREKNVSPIDLDQFKHYSNLSTILKQRLSGISLDLVTGLLESWRLAGDYGHRKSVVFVSFWNEISDKPIQMEASKEILDLFRAMSKISYAEKSNIIEDILGEISGIEAFGIEAFRDRFEFLIAKSDEVILEVVKFFKTFQEKATLVSALPAEKRRIVMNSLDPESKTELIMAMMGLRDIPIVDLDLMANAIKTQLPAIQQKTESGSEVMSVTKTKSDLYEGLGAEAELNVIKKMVERNPDVQEWLKSRYFGVSLMPELSSAALGELFAKLDTDTMISILIVFDDTFVERVLKIQPPMKQTIVKSRLIRDREENKKPDWKTIDRWVASVRRDLKNGPAEMRAPTYLYSSFDESRARRFERPSKGGKDGSDDGSKAAA